MEDASDGDLLDLGLGIASYCPGITGLIGGLGQAGMEANQGNYAAAGLTAACSVGGVAGKVA